MAGRPAGAKDSKPRTRTSEKRDLDEKLNSMGLALEDAIMMEWEEIKTLKEEVDAAPDNLVTFDNGKAFIIVASRGDVIKKLNEFNKAVLAYRASKMPAKKQISYEGQVSLSDAKLLSGDDSVLNIVPHFKEEILEDENGHVISSTVTAMDPDDEII